MKRIKTPRYPRNAQKNAQKQNAQQIAELWMIRIHTRNWNVPPQFLKYLYKVDFPGVPPNLRVKAMAAAANSHHFIHALDIVNRKALHRNTIRPRMGPHINLGYLKKAIWW